MPMHQGQTLHFGPFTLDPHCGELRTNGSRIKLQGQPIQILEILLEKPGELVSREEMRQKLWSSDTFVDFDHNLNTAVKKLRQALGDEADTPKYIETLPRYGYRFIGEVAQEEDRQPTPPASQSSLEQAPTQKPEHRPKTLLTALSAGILAAILISFFMIYRWLRPQPSLISRVPVRAQLKFRGGNPSGPHLSRDGRFLLYFAGPTYQLWIKDLQEGTDEPLPGTDGVYFPFWSPDGRYIAFFTDTSPRKLKKIALDSRIISEISDFNAWSSSWGTSNVIVVSSALGIEAVSALSGQKRLVVPRDVDSIDTSPDFLPDGNHFFFVRIPVNRYYTRGASGVLYLGSLDGTQPYALGVRVSDSALYAAGHVLYNTQHGIFAQRFDVSRLRLLGNPVLLVPFMGMGAGFTASDSGMLVTRPALTAYVGESELQLYTRDGQPVGEAFARGYPDQARFSPDGKRIAYDQITGDYRDIWIYDLERHMNTRLTSGDSTYVAPVWSPDGKRIAYQGSHKHSSDIAVRNSDGSGEPEIIFQHTAKDPLGYWPRSWNPTEDCLFVTAAERPNGVRKIGVLCLNGDRKIRFLADSKNSSRSYPMISPDGKWLAYSSNEAGGYQIFVEPYPGTGANVRVSAVSAAFAFWSRDSRELFFRSSDVSDVVAASLTFTGNNIKVEKLSKLFMSPPRLPGVAVPIHGSPDGQLFVVNVPMLPFVPTDTYDIITNWDLLIKK